MGFAPNTAEGTLNLATLPNDLGFGTIPCYFEGVILENGTPIGSVLFLANLSRGEATLRALINTAYGAPEFTLERTKASRLCALSERGGVERRPDTPSRWQERAAIGTIRGAVATRLELLRPVVEYRYNLTSVRFEI
jgi:hypothetical protein